MNALGTLSAAVTNDVLLIAQGVSDGPVGPEFGKASPVGMLLLVALAVAVLSAGWAFHRRHSRFRRRAMFAEEHGIDPFDQEAIDAAMAERGLYDRRKQRKF